MKAQRLRIKLRDEQPLSIVDQLAICGDIEWFGQTLPEDVQKMVEDRKTKGELIPETLFLRENMRKTI